MGGQPIDCNGPCALMETAEGDLDSGIGEHQFVAAELAAEALRSAAGEGGTEQRLEVGGSSGPGGAVVEKMLDGGDQGVAGGGGAKACCSSSGVQPRAGAAAMAQAKASTQCVPEAGRVSWSARPRAALRAEQSAPKMAP